MENVVDEDVLETLKIDQNKRKVHVMIHIIEFADGGSYVIYNQSLGLSAYGDSPKAAKEMFVNIVLPDFCENLLVESETAAYDFLYQHGWTQNSNHKKDLVRITHVNRQGLLREFDLSEDTVLSEDFIAA